MLARVPSLGKGARVGAADRREASTEGWAPRPAPAALLTPPASSAT